jgi:hypothetical protein
MKKTWILAVAAAGTIAYGARGCFSKAAPDERLAHRFDELCEIAHDNLDTPERGVRALGAYMAHHTGDMLGDFGDTIALIEQVADDEAHDERALLARKRLVEPLVRCEPTWSEFFGQVNDDPAASELMSRFGERFSRTLEIMFGSGQHDLRDVVRQLELRLTPERT